MKKIFFMMVILAGFAAAFCMAQIDPNDPAVILAQTSELQKQAKEFPPKVKELKTKVYSGTFDKIMAERTVDVNSVASEARNICDKAVELARIEKIQTGRHNALKAIFENKTKKDKLKEKSDVAIITSWMVDELNELDEADPNYISNVETFSACINIMLQYDAEFLQL